jgi:hypothetical protein
MARPSLACAIAHGAVGRNDLFHRGFDPACRREDEYIPLPAD